MGKIIGIGPHYQCLLEKNGVALAKEPFIFIKPMSSIIQTGEAIYLPTNVEMVLAEVEIAVKMNKNVKNITVEEAQDPSIIAGFAISNDVTARGDSLPALGKLYDTFTPIGEFQKVENVQEIKIESYLNGKLQQSALASTMGFSIPFLISYISSLFTLEAGDIILTGTPANAFEIQAGDRIELKSPQLGTVVNEVK